MTAMNSAFGNDPAVTVLPAAPEPSSTDEMNHRIANSLQLLSAMVSVEARTIEDPAALAALDMTQRRIGAIASVHRHLYRMHETSVVDLCAYLNELGADLEAGCGSVAIDRHVIVQAAPVAVTAEDATAIGIVVSELVSNACKYAYAADEPGDVRITLHHLPLRGYLLEVEDRGRGLAEAVIRGTGLGSRLVHMMVRRLGGSHGYHARPGTRFVLRVSRP